MEYTQLTFICSLFFSILLSCLFSASETAFTGCSKARLHYLSQSDNPAAIRLLKLTQKQEITIGCLLLANNLVNILASALVTDFCVEKWGDRGIAYATLIMTIVIFVFAEMIPKNYALRHTDSIALKLSSFIAIVTFICQPLVIALKIITKKMYRTPEANDMLHEEILRGTIDLHSQNEDFLETGKMLNSILDLEDITIREVMKHRSQIESIDLKEDTPDSMIDIIIKSPGTLIVVTDNAGSDVLGLLYCKTAMQHIYDHKEQHTALDLKSLIIDHMFSLETTSLREQVQAFQEKEIYASIVVDEYGEFLGLVTQTDILEEIVGTRHKDSQKTILPGVILQGHSYFIEGKVTLRDLNRALDWNLSDDQASTIAGFLLYKTKTIPDVGQIFTFNDLTFEIISKNNTAITRIKVTPLTTDTI